MQRAVLAAIEQQFKKVHTKLQVGTPWAGDSAGCCRLFSCLPTLEVAGTSLCPLSHALLTIQPAP